MLLVIYTIMGFPSRFTSGWVLFVTETSLNRRLCFPDFSLEPSKKKQ